MKCKKCGYEPLQDTFHCCPACGAPVTETDIPRDPTRIHSTTDIGTMSESTVKGTEIGTIEGPATITSVVHQVESKVIAGDYVDRGTIINNINISESNTTLEGILQALLRILAVDEDSLRFPGRGNVSEHAGHQIKEIIAVQKDLVAKGMHSTPESLYELGILAAHQGYYDQALVFFHQALSDNPKFFRGYQAIAWLQHGRALQELQQGNPDTATALLDEAEEAADQMDPGNPESLTQKGFILNMRAQIACEKGKEKERDTCYLNAADFFEKALQKNPSDANAHRGLGNVQAALGAFDAAIASYHMAIKLDPDTVLAHHDLARAYESCAVKDPGCSCEWSDKALHEWGLAHALVKDDPNLSEEINAALERYIPKPRVLNGHTESVNALAFTPDGSRLVSGSSDKTVKVWDLATKWIKKSIELKDGIRQLKITPDGKKLVVYSGDSLRIHDLETGKETRQISNSITSEGKLSEDGSLFIEHPDNKEPVSVYYLNNTGPDSRREFAVDIFDGRLGNFVITPDNRFAAGVFYGRGSPHQSHHIGILDLINLRLHKVLSKNETNLLQEAYVPQLLISPDSVYLLSFMNDTMLIWNIEKGTLLTQYAHRGESSHPSRPILMPKENLVICYEGPWNAGNIRIIECSTGKVFRTIRGLLGITSIRISHDRATLALGFEGGAIHLWDLNRILKDFTN